MYNPAILKPFMNIFIVVAVPNMLPFDEPIPVIAREYDPRLAYLAAHACMIDRHSIYIRVSIYEVPHDYDIEKIKNRQPEIPKPVFTAYEDFGYKWRQEVDPRFEDSASVAIVA